MYNSGVIIKLPEGDCELRCARNDIDSGNILAPTITLPSGEVIGVEEYYMSKYKVGEYPYDTARIMEMVLVDYYSSLLTREIKINLSGGNPNIEAVLDVQKRIGPYDTFYYIKQQAEFVRGQLNRNYTKFA